MSIFGTRTYNPKTGRTVTTTGNRTNSGNTQTATPKYNPPKYGGYQGGNNNSGGVWYANGTQQKIKGDFSRWSGKGIVSGSADDKAFQKEWDRVRAANKVVNGGGGNNNNLSTAPGAGAGGGQGGQGQEAYNYIKELQKSPGMTPEQTQLLRNRISDTHASQRQGSEERLRGQMARSGLAGSGQETKGLLANEASNMSSLQNALTSQDLANMQMENQNKMTLAGLGVQASGQNDRNAFNYAQLAQQGGQYQQNFGWEQYLNELNQYYYNQQQGQWNNWLNQLM